MHSSQILAAAVALMGVASAATCDKPIKITEADQVIDCTKVTADITVSSDLGGDVKIEGPTELTGNLIVSNNTKILSLSSSSLKTINGDLQLDGLNFLGTLKMSALKSVTNVNLVNLASLTAFTFGTGGITKASSVTVRDTRISDLRGLNMLTIDTFNLQSNGQLISWDSPLVNITKMLTISANAPTLQINMTDLEFADGISVSGVKSFSVPALSLIGSSLRLNKNPDMTSFAAANLTQVGKDKKSGASLSFTNNTKLATVSLPSLKTDNGDMNVVGNTAMTNISGFPQLETVFGALIIGGNFSTIDLPKVSRVEGGAIITSTEDISSFCKDAYPKLGGKGNQNINKCTANNTKANSAKQGSDGNTGGSNDNKSAGSSSVISYTTLALGLLVGAFQLL